MLDGCTPWPAEVAERYRDEGHWRGENLGDLLRSWAEEHGEADALVHGDCRISYRELDRRVDRVAAGFRRHGVARGDRIVLQLPNVPEFVVVAFALFRAGAVPVFSLASHRAHEIRHLCALSGAVGYVVPRAHRGFDHLALARQMLEEVTDLRRVFVVGAEDGDCTGNGEIPFTHVDSDPAPMPVPDPGDVAFFLLSGGTTALPKLIPRTHDDYNCQIRATAGICEISEDDVYLAVLPVEFNFAWGCPGVLGTLSTGGTVVLVESPTADDCFRTIVREKVTITSLVPTVVQLWLEALEWSHADLSSLRIVQSGGARLPVETARRIEPAFGCFLQQVFGMAEGLLTLSRKDDDPESVVTTQGRPITTADEIRIVDDEECDVPTGTTGELLARGPYTLRGYFRAEEHNERAFTVDGFYRTGDLARLTDGGNLVIEGRIKDVVIRGDNKVSAGEIEEHLITHSTVSRAAVVPVPDETLGERICAYVVARGERPTLLELKRALHEQGLADFKLPDRVEFVDTFPLTELGKVDKKELAAMAVRKAPGPTAPQEG